jgi:selenophosphate synthetase-related protein
MNISLSELVPRIRNHMGLVRKQPIEEVFSRLVLHGPPGPQLPNYGDDAAVIPWGEGFLLLAADGMMTGLLKNEPYAAGKASVMVTVNDIYSMGGRPIGLVNVLASGDEAQRAQIVEGIRKGCEKLRVPMLGGHLHPDAPLEVPSLAVAILGSARKVIRSHLSEAGDDIVFAADLKGRKGCHSAVSWDANSGKSSEELLSRLEAMPLIAERQWAHAAKDVSNAGLLGTVSIMMESAGKGAIVDLPSIPCPGAVDLTDWILSFLSFGFTLSVPPERSGDVLRLFQERDVQAAVIGKVVHGTTVILNDGESSRTLFDFQKDKITGIVYRSVGE